MKKKLPYQSPVTFYNEQGYRPRSCDSLRAAFGGCSLAQRCGASHPTRCFLAALGRATFPPGEGVGADLSFFANAVAWHKELVLTAY